MVESVLKLKHWEQKSKIQNCSTMKLKFHEDSAGFNMQIIDTVSLHDDDPVNYNTMRSRSVLVL